MDNLPKVGTLTNWIKKGDWQSIAQHLSHLAAADYDDDAYFAKGLLLFYGPIEQRNIDLALSLIEKSCLLTPTKINYQNTYSEVLLQVKQPKKAFDIALLCHDRFPNNGLSAIALGRAAWECKNREVAHRSYQQALQLLPQELTEVRSQISHMLFKLAPFWWSSVQGRRLILVRKGLQHTDFLIECRQNKDFHHHYNLFQEATPDAVKRELKVADRPPLDSKKIEWVVEKNGQPIGVAALVDLNMNNSRAELLIGFPGDVSALATVEATLLVLEFAFATLGLFKVYSYVYSDNPKGQKNTLSLGFEQEGILKSHVQDPYLKQRLDLYVNGCLQDDFFSNITLMKMAQRLLGRVPQASTCDGTVSGFD
jgi:diamine N-acetyltransferase